ncbi:hypothetical protein [Candidatus Pantoea persica]|uniref:hypothetical protein n=1 Tax=Candidatus Pantoea persica TaxID=2518128 RepID=UPI00215D77EC|nr:hypothetical protein [Candidatus Pantoea persica]MBA2814295.1 hypothetical protein [Candidatus Pantoea persica]
MAAARAGARWRTDRFHVGSNAGFASMVGKVTVNAGETQPVELTWGGSAVVYLAQVKGDAWILLPMPFFLTDA